MRVTSMTRETTTRAWYLAREGGPVRPILQLWVTPARITYVKGTGCVGVRVAVPQPSISLPPSILAYLPPTLLSPAPRPRQQTGLGTCERREERGAVGQTGGKGGGSFEGRIIPLVELFENTSTNLLYVRFIFFISDTKIFNFFINLIVLQLPFRRYFWSYHSLDSLPPQKICTSLIRWYASFFFYILVLVASQAWSVIERP